MCFNRLLFYCLSLTIILHGSQSSFYLIRDDLANTVLSGIERALHFIYDNYETSTFDCYYGVFMAQVYLKSFLQNVTDENHLSRIHVVINIAKELKEMMLPIQPPKFDWMKEHLLKEELWGDDNVAFDRKLNFNAIHHANRKLKFNYSEEESDRCIQEAAMYESKTLQFTECIFSKKCQIMFIDPLYMGELYQLTHRYLFLKYGKDNCPQLREAFSSQISELCVKMYQAAESHMNSDVSFIDLLFEYIIFCGTEGYGEFFKLKWLYRFLATQHPDGCYRSYSLKSLANVDLPLKRKRRESNLFENGCSDHTTGLATTALALYLKYMWSLELDYVNN